MTKQKNKDADARQTTPEPSCADSDAEEERADPNPRNRPATMIRPVTKKIGESDDNLRGRSEWYRRRTGGA
ncbi:MAG TPA: hypothetical protein VGV59_10195 [Pyrinomonadaceae bacterium]|nr:hypothetical protein [Pyrinomonadaceae bacterium]